MALTALFFLLALPAFLRADDRVNATLWMYTSAEYGALVTQTYDIAAQRLPQALAAHPSLGAIENHHNAFHKPPAIVLDIDETVLDNSAWQAAEIDRGQQAFDPESWNKWVLQHRAVAVPGALDYVTAARRLGITVFFVTNRACTAPADCPQEAATLKNLHDQGFVNVDADHLLLRNEHSEWTGNKAVRRAEIADNFRIVQIIGDDLNDFIPGARAMTPEQRRNTAADYRHRFGRTWYQLPNPVYGSWERSLGEEAANYLKPDAQ